MDSFNQKLERISSAKEAIKTSLTNKGMSPSDNIEDYAQIIDSIESGSGDVKLFATEEEMQADTTAKEGDLAIVYRNEVQNVTVDSKFQTATFPDTVVLDTAITSSVEVRYRAVDSSKMFDCMGQLNSSRFHMDCYTERGRIRIQYTSSDGITYTRADTTGNPVDFGTEIYYERAEMWNDAIGKFIQVSRSVFEGLFSYQNSTDMANKLHFYKNIRYDLTCDDDIVLDISDILELFYSKYSGLNIVSGYANDKILAYINEIDGENVTSMTFCFVPSGFGVVGDQTLFSDYYAYNKYGANSTNVDYTLVTVNTTNGSVTTELKTTYNHTSTASSAGFVLGPTITDKYVTEFKFDSTLIKFIELSDISVIGLTSGLIGSNTFKLYSKSVYKAITS